VFHPLAGTPKNLDRSRPSISIDIRTEPLYGETHDVFFNRGVASSQAYARKFGNVSPSNQPSQRKRREALQWLSRDLDEAMLRFIRSARSGDAIRGCFYEFSYGPVLAALAAAIIRREARRSAIAHNKFMVLLTGNPQLPDQLWTGSTNLTDGGIHGQANTGHWIRDATTAAKFHAYWELLATDPGGRHADTQSIVRARNREFYTSVDLMSPRPPAMRSRPGSPLFSPRSGSLPLQLYVALLDEANDLSCITFAFTAPTCSRRG
jgi:hypothetical protein